MNGWYGYGGGIGAFLVSLLILIVIFLVCREIICWYWKINKAMELLERQNVLLERIEAKLSAAPRPAAPADTGTGA